MSARGDRASRPPEPRVLSPQAPSPGGTSPLWTTSRIRVLGSAFAGTTIEWYDFYLYGIAAALVFSKQFFQGGSPFVSLLASFATLAVGVLVRPLGGIIAGHIGDRAGRKTLLVASLLVMGVSSTAIGLLPTAAQAGAWAPTGLVALRVLQGLSAGAEWGGSALISVESAPPEHRGLFGSFTQIGSAGGMLLATGAWAVVRGACTAEQFAAFGWRLPFLLSGLMVAVALWIRVGVADAREFAAARDAGSLLPRPTLRVLAEHRRALLVTVFLRVAQNGIYYLVTVWLLTYLEGTGGGSGPVMSAIMLASALGLVSGPVWGALSDRWGRRRLSLAGYLGIGVFVWVLFLASAAGAWGLLPVVVLLGLLFAHDVVYGPQAAWFAEQFPVEVRYSGVSMGYQIGTLVGGGLMPFIAAVLLNAGHGRPWLIAGYLSVLVALSVVAACCAADPAARTSRGLRSRRSAGSPRGPAAAASSTASSTAADAVPSTVPNTVTTTAPNTVSTTAPTVQEIP